MNVQKARVKRAKTLHLRGYFDAAEEIYLRHLDVNPGDVECLNLLGLLHADTNRYETSLQLLRAAIGIEGPKPWLCRNLGIVLERTGDLASACACYRQALASAPEDHGLWAALAQLQANLGQHRDAAISLQTAFLSDTCTPTSRQQYRLSAADAWLRAGDGPAAIALYDEVLKKQPDHKIATFHRAVAWMQCGDLKNARFGFLQTLALSPRHAEAANNLGVLSQLERKLPEAIAHYRSALAFDPNYSSALYNLGAALQESHRLREAICVFRKLLKTQPDHTSAWVNLGNALLGQNQVSPAMAAYQHAVSVTPGDPTAEWNLGITSLLTGDFTRGWMGYERRFSVAGAPPRRQRKAPLWQGQSLTGKTLLLHAEQGLGDTIQFARYAEVFSRQGASVYLEAQAPLIPLLQSTPGVAKLFTPSPEDPDADFHLPLLSAPRLAGTTIDTIPFADHYLQAPAPAVAKWRQWLGPRSAHRKRVGICWAGNPNHKNDYNRSIPPQLLRILDELPGVEWVNLQKGHALPPLNLRDAARELQDFGDTAGLVANLDLVISVDTSVAHLAGALGKPVWILLPFAPDWRWMLEREDTPWYKHAKLFRQQTLREWQPVLHRVVQALSALP